MLKAKRNDEYFEMPKISGFDTPLGLIHSNNIEDDVFTQLENITRQKLSTFKSNFYKLSIKLMNELRDQLYRYVHIENNVLLTKTVLLQQEIISNNALKE